MYILYAFVCKMYVKKHMYTVCILYVKYIIDCMQIVCKIYTIYRYCI